MRALLLTLASLLLPAVALAHGGGLDGYGCHHNRKAGGYHCHQGPRAGESFSSQQEMRQQLSPGLQPYSAGAEAARPTKQGKAAGSVEQRLRQLDDLRAKGLLTEGEYGEKRKAILDDL